MAQLLFDSITGGMSTIDSQAVLAVQSLLDSQAVVTGETGISTATEDEDVFQCGKCKKQFTSLTMFMAHKKDHCGTLSSTRLPSVSQNPLVVCSTPNGSSSHGLALAPANLGRQLPQQSQIQVPASPLTAITPGVVLSEADLLSLTASIDQSIATISGSHGFQTVASSVQNSLLPQINSAEVSLASTVHQVPSSPAMGQMALSEMVSQHDPQPDQHNPFQHEQQATSVGLSLLSHTLVPMPLLVSSQPTTTSTGSAMMCTVSNPVTSNVVNKLRNKLLTAVTTITNSLPVAKDTSQFSMPLRDVTSLDSIDAANKSPSSQKGDSTVNIITEFHASMVKPRKKEGNGEIIDSGLKRSQKLKCAYCSKTFGKNFDLQQHIRCHTGEKPFQCIVCGRAFAQKSNVKKHMQTHKVWPDGLAHTLPHQPAIRQVTVPSKLGPVCPTSEPVEPQEFNCVPVPNSKTECTDDGDVITVVENTYVCPYCNFNCGNYLLLKTHMKQHKTEKVYKCIVSTCGQMFHDLDPFLEHTKSHESEMTYRCHICHKTFQSLYDLGVHQYTHSLYPSHSNNRSGPRYYRCSQCMNKYSTPSALDHHMATSTHNYPCTQCDKIFPCERYLRRHLQTHGTAEVYVCPICNKGFKTEHYRRAHLLIHSGEKPFKCSQCSAAFNRRDKLKRHRLVHDPVKRYKCPFRTHTGCQKEFNRPDKLKAHILTHSGFKPYVCKTCGRMFTRKAHLREHEQLHLDGQRAPYQCSRCGLGFTREKLLQDHICTEARGARFRSDFRAFRSCRTRRARVLSNRSGSKMGDVASHFPRKRGRPKRFANSEDPGSEHKSDDIPTAHIEIISTTGDLSSHAPDVSHLALHPAITISGLQLHPLVTHSSTTEKQQQCNHEDICESSILPDVSVEDTMSFAAASLPNGVPQQDLMALSAADCTGVLNGEHETKMTEITCTVVLPADDASNSSS